MDHFTEAVACTGGGLGATMLSISQMCKPYVLRGNKKKRKKTERHERNL